MIHRSTKSALFAAAGASLLFFGAVGIGVPKAGTSETGYEVLSPITQGNLTIFPVVVRGDRTLPDTRHFLTLDEGVRSGKLVITEADKIRGLVRGATRLPRTGPEVNRLVLINDSSQPVILLAGEIVTGGKQDRVIGKDRIVPPHSDPVDLGVFCVEPGRWVEASNSFGSENFMMAQPSVRKHAMADRNQQEVWSEVRRSSGVMAMASPPIGRVAGGTSSYARVMASAGAVKEVNAVANPIERSYDMVIKDLRNRKAVGVVAAVNGRVVWADIFADTSLLERYWPKLVRSYAAEALTRNSGGNSDAAGVKAAQEFLDKLQGRHEVADTEPGVYRHTEVRGDNFTVFELVSLLAGTGFSVHLAKMAGTAEIRPQPWVDRGILRTPDILVVPR